MIHTFYKKSLAESVVKLRVRVQVQPDAFLLQFLHRVLKNSYYLKPVTEAHYAGPRYCGFIEL